MLVREVGAGTWSRNWAEAVEESCLLVCSACFLIHIRATYPKMAKPPVELVFPHQLLIKAIPGPQDLSIGQSDGSMFSIKIPSSGICLGLCQLDKNHPVHSDDSPTQDQSGTSTSITSSRKPSLPVPRSCPLHCAHRFSSPSYPHLVPLQGH